ncbi:unnamed protein product [Prunus armeniaca]
MPDISPEVIIHKLSISPAYKPMRQKCRSYDAERYEAMRTEVDKLQAIDFIREATYPVRLVNFVMVRKAKGGWRMCQDYIDLNKACPKDSFRCPGSTSLWTLYRSRVAQLHGCLFGNTGATYQRLVNRIFAKHIGSIMEVYVDDMLVKSRMAEGHLDNLGLMFCILKDYRMRLNLTKCSFGVSSGEVLFLYLSVSSTAVSSVLIRKPEKAELPIFYVNKALQSAESRYPPLEQLALALVVSARRLCTYFQAHEIMWTIELGEFDIQFKPRSAEKGQAIADFIFELTPSVAFEPANPCTDAEELGNLVLTTPNEVKVEYALRFNFETSNNEAEYEAILASLRLAKSMNAKQVSIHSDSQLIANQIAADFAAKDASMTAYLSTIHQLIQKFQAYEIRQIPRTENRHTDVLARLASTINDKVGRRVPVEILAQPNTITFEVCTVRYKNTWMSSIYAYLLNGTLPHDKSQARKL